ncbi:hypothetical protein [Pandoraea commovens]|uniref:Sel1 repeat family protein n=1 Tax=Pandoraea commovens TaxID=2508289 RepID=A0ABY5QA39_9BURK|nr:hypothetical protein [Pandoraea commovens]UVA77178.1 hypothetical protein NTU39_00140 [Pandoraea commovens]
MDMTKRPFLRTIVVLLSAIFAAFDANPSHAQGSPGGAVDVRNFAETTFNSDTFKNFVNSYQKQNSTVVDSITSSAVFNAQAALPKAMEYGTRLRYGEHNVVSNDGETIVSWMIQLTNSESQKRKELLAKLSNLASQRNPEALNFAGFIAEYGLFGEAKNLALAIDFYRAAATFNYQPAIYNLALAAAYGKGQAADLNNASSLISQAFAIAPDGSYRVCGFGAFLSYRQGDRTNATRYSSTCWSALANIPRAIYDERTTNAQKIGLLRESIATGVDDGYSLLARVTSEAGSDPQYTACKYMLVNRYRKARDNKGLRDDAVKCYQQSIPSNLDAKEATKRMAITVPGITAFVPIELSALEKMRSANKFHYAWSVPYLPFRQQDVDAFLPFVAHRKP